VTSQTLSDPILALRSYNHTGSSHDLGGIRSDGSVALQAARGSQTVKFDPVLQNVTRHCCTTQRSKAWASLSCPTMITQDLAEKRVELVLPELPQMGGQLFGVYPSRKYLSAKVRTFLDYVARDRRLKIWAEAECPPCGSSLAGCLPKGPAGGLAF
jgi:hypothetical protein